MCLRGARAPEDQYHKSRGLLRQEQPSASEKAAHDNAKSIDKLRTSAPHKDCMGNAMQNETCKELGASTKPANLAGRPQPGAMLNRRSGHLIQA